MISLKINGESRGVDVSPDTPLLWVLRDHLDITSVKYACGVSECGVCTMAHGSRWCAGMVRSTWRSDRAEPALRTFRTRAA